jgi:hypothetical protein
MYWAVNISGARIPVKATASALLLYRAAFGQDGMLDIFSMYENNDDYSGIATVSNRLLWSFAKAADSTIPPIDEWFAALKMTPSEIAVETLPQVMDITRRLMTTRVKNKTASGEKSGDRVTTELLMIRAVGAGLNIDAFDRMTVGMLVDYLTARSNDIIAQRDKPTEATRAATQADIDAF